MFAWPMHHPDRVRRLVLMEAMLGWLPGTEDFLRDGTPWWFGFHAVPDLAEAVLTGHEGSYIDWFLTTGTRGLGVPAHLRTAFVNAYTGAEALRAAFAHYRALPESGRQIEKATATTRLRMPTLAVGAHPVGDVPRAAAAILHRRSGRGSDPRRRPHRSGRRAIRTATAARRLLGALGPIAIASRRHRMSYRHNASGQLVMRSSS